MSPATARTWRWDGERWIEIDAPSDADAREHHDAISAAPAPEGGQWHWDGERWQPRSG